ncbi:dystrobrevin binding protein dysbindin [Leptinotarsa decemlineata]|uniref:dystrobrevin binding protein dysbindin n=1 Tax=Leptinotarsa decemlineata TaxID=7539 RepID=UPI003D30CCC7
MLSNLKEKMLSVSLFNSGEEKQLEKKVINFNAGAEILQQFQNQWEELHKINEENAEKAEQVAKEIICISNELRISITNLDLIDHLITKSNLAININDCLSTIKDLYKTAESIEMNLIGLEDLIDEIDLTRKQRHEKEDLQRYQVKKKLSLESLKVAWREEHLKKIEEYEASRKVLLEERQRAFQDAFKTDLELYKSLGTLPEKEHSENQNALLLEDIQLDFDEKELEKFFNDD